MLTIFLYVAKKSAYLHRLAEIKLFLTIRTKTIQYWILNHLSACKGKHYFPF